MTAEQKRAIASRKVESFMVADVIVIDPTMTIREAINLCLDNKISGAPIVDSSGRVLSVVSESDLMRFAAESGIETDINSKLSKLVAPDKVITVRRQDTFKDVFKIFLTNRIRRVIVVDGSGKLQGIVARGEVLRAFMEEQDA